MKTTNKSLWLVLIALTLVVSCGKKNDDNNNAARPGSGGYYPPGGYPPPTGQAPGGLLASTAGTVRIDNEGLQVDFELYIKSNVYNQVGGATSNGMVEGQIRMNQSDSMCQIMLPIGIHVMTVRPDISQVSLTNSGGFVTMSGKIAVQGPTGIFYIGMNSIRLNPRAASGPAIGFSGNQFPFMMVGRVQPGSCQNPSMHTDWSFDSI